MSTFRFIIIPMTKVFIKCVIKLFSLQQATNKSIGQWLCARALAEKCKHRNQMSNSNGLDSQIRNKFLKY